MANQPWPTSFTTGSPVLLYAPLLINDHMFHTWINLFDSLEQTEEVSKRLGRQAATQLKKTETRVKHLTFVILFGFERQTRK